MSGRSANQFSSQRCSFLLEIHGFVRIRAASVFVMSEARVHVEGIITELCNPSAHEKNNCRGGTLYSRALTAPQRSIYLISLLIPIWAR